MMLLRKNDHYHPHHGTHGTVTRIRNGQESRIMDSPTLARVERAILRHEEGTNREEEQNIIRVGYTQSLLSTGNNYGKESTHAIKRGLLWQQRDKLFSRWKERYFILTRDYLHCFRRASGADRISEMGQFLFKIKLVDVDHVEWENKKTYSTVALIIGRDGKIYLRAADGLEDWFEILEECMLTSKERRKALRNTSHHNNGKSKDNNNLPSSSSSTLDDWLIARQKYPLGRQFVENNSITQQQEITLRRKKWYPTNKDEEDWDNSSSAALDNRLSLLTDIDINSYDDSTLGAPSVTSYRLSRDILCVQPPSLRTSSSIRSSSKDTNQTPKCVINNIPADTQCQYIKFRERSYSDIQHVERKHWRSLAINNQ